MTFGVDEAYDWALVDLLLEAQKMVYGCFDKLSEQDSNSRLAVRKLRTRMYTATSTIKKAVANVKSTSSPNASRGDEAVDQLRKKLTQFEQYFEEKDKALLEQET